MMNLYLARMQWLAFAFANVWQIEPAHRSFESNYFFSLVHSSCASLTLEAAPGVVVAKKAFSFDTILFLCNFSCFGVGVVPDPCQSFSGFDVVRFYQFPG